MAHIKQINVTGQDSTSSYLIEPTLFIVPTKSNAAYSASFETNDALTNFELAHGIAIQVKFNNTNDENATLNVNNTGAKNIYYDGITLSAGILTEGRTYTLIYNANMGANGGWELVGEIDTQLVTGVKGSSESSYRTGNVNITKSNIGLGSVENTKLSTWKGTANITTVGNLTAGNIPWSLLSGVPTTLGSGGYGITDAHITNGVITLGSDTITPITSINNKTGSSITLTAGDLNLSSALRFIGKTTSQMSENFSGVPAGITDYTTPIIGDVVLDASSDYEYVCISTDNNSYTWEKLGGDSSWSFNDHTHGHITNDGKADDNTITEENAAVTTGHRFLREDGLWVIPKYTTDTNTRRAIKVNGTQILSTTSTTALNLASGAGMTISNSSGTVTFAISGIDTENGSNTQCLTAKGTWEDFNNYELPIAKYDTLGGLKPLYTLTTALTGVTAGSYNETPTLVDRSTTESRYYAIEADKNGIPFVNVPWTDTYDWDSITGKPTFGTNAFTSDAYLPLTGGEMTGNITMATDPAGDTIDEDGVILLANSGTKIIQKLRDNSNWGLALGWNTATPYTTSYLPGIGYHNTKKTISIVPYATNTSPWGRTVGLSIGETTLYFENKRVPTTSDTTGTVGSTNSPVYVNQGVITAIDYTIQSNVPENAVFTDTHDWDSLDNKPTTLGEGGYGITDAKIEDGVITLGQDTITPITSVNNHTGSSITLTAGDLGLSSALRFIGKTTTTIAADPYIGLPGGLGEEYIPIIGDVILDANSDSEYVCISAEESTYTWERLGRDSSWAYSNHTHGNISNDGKKEDTTITAGSDVTVNDLFLREDGTWVKPKYLTLGTSADTALAGNTDITKVAIAKNDTTSTGNYPVMYSAKTTSTTAAQTGTSAGTLKKSTSTFYFTPKSGTLHATNFVGDSFTGELTGNADTATAWAESQKVQVDLETIYGTGTNEVETAINANSSDVQVIGITGTLGIEHGGTGLTEVVKYGIAYGDVSEELFAFTDAGDDGYFLISRGGNYAPTWQEILPVTHGGTGVNEITEDCAIIYSSTSETFAATGLKIEGNELSDITLSPYTAKKSITISTVDSTGNIDLATSTGTIEFSTTKGTIEAVASDTGTISISTNTGKLEVYSDKGAVSLYASTGKVSVYSNYGSLEIVGGKKNTVQQSTLTLGNATAKTSNNQSEGVIKLYSSGKEGHKIVGESTNTEYTHTFPKHEGWIASGVAEGVADDTTLMYLTDQGVLTASTNTIGSTTQAVYLNGGTIEAIEYTENRLYYSASTNSFNATKHYASETAIGINTTTWAENSTDVLYVNGTSTFADEVAMLGDLTISGDVALEASLSVDGTTALLGHVGINAESNEDADLYVTGTIFFDLGASSTADENEFKIGSTDYYISISSQELQAYAVEGSTVSESILKLQPYGGSLDIGSEETHSEERNMYGLFDFASSNGFTYTGIAARSSNAASYIWFSDYANSAIVAGRPVYDTDFQYNPNSNKMTIGKLTVTGGTSNSTISSSGTLSLSGGSKKAVTITATQANTYIVYGNTASNKLIFSHGGTADENQVAYFDGSGHFIPAATETFNLGQGGNTPLRWNALYIGDNDSYGDAYTPIYWNDGVPAPIALIQQAEFTISANTTSTTITKTGIYTEDTIVLAIVIKTGESYLNSKISWTSSTDKVILSHSKTSGDITGYILTARGEVI